MKRFYVSFILIFLSGWAVGQHSHRAYLELADSLYEHHHYQSAAVYYQRAIKNAAEPEKIMLQVATCFQKMNKVTEAEQWYEKAKLNNATFSHTDIYHYAGVLMMLEKRDKAEMLLRELLAKDPNAFYAKQLLDDLQHIEKYYKDSLQWQIAPLSINTTVSEFAPEYYKDGIVFSSAQPDHFAKKKYHWDDSHFLNLFYSAKTDDTNFKKPTPFNKELNSRFHDGPVAFYANYERMIVNRNRQMPVEGKKDTWVWHLSLYDARLNADKTWELTPLPFDEPPYSFAHPSISEDGNVLYFISDKPGGYGGTDIYRVERINGVWGKPFNVGPVVNTTENEVFPFCNNNTLYFSSDGHGGLGGLDIFKSERTVNGFTPPVNLGYPVNSHVDDFSLITTSDHRSGYFSSARNGNDDLFFFQQKPIEINILAHIYDGITKHPLSSANIQLITTSSDLTLTSDSTGNLHFKLPEETAYILIATKENKTGMLSGYATSQEDIRHVTHLVPLYGDTTRIPCVGNIRDELGLSQKASTIFIVDETSGEKLDHSQDQSLVSFLGEKGHTYRIEIQNSKGDTTIHSFTINPDELNPKTWSMVLKEASTAVDMAARIFKAEDNTPLDGAIVKIITFAEPDQELIADAGGLVEFSLPEGTAYIIIGTKDSLSGMNSGIAEQAVSKAAMIHPVPAHGDPVVILPAVAVLITDKNGNVLNNVQATVTDKATGEAVTAEIKDGVVTFTAKSGKEYNITVEHEDYQTVLEEISIPAFVTEVEKISITMEEDAPSTHTNNHYLIAVRVFREDDQTPVSGASVKVLSFELPDMELTANEDGVADFTLSEGSAYIAIGTKDGLTGMHSGIVEKGKEKTSIIHPIAAHGDRTNQLPVVGLITDKSGNVILEADVVVTEKPKGDKVPVQFKDGILSFYGEKGKEYSIAVDHSNYLPALEEIRVPEKDEDISKISISLEKSPSDEIDSGHSLPITASITDKQGNTIRNANVSITDESTGENIPVNVDNGLVTFQGEKGKKYSVNVQHENYLPASKEITVPQEEASTNISISMEQAQQNADDQLSVIARITDEEGKVLSNVGVTVVEKESGKKMQVQAKDGILNFYGKKGKDYSIILNHPDYPTKTEDVIIPDDETNTKNIALTMGKPVSRESNQKTVSANIADSDGTPLNEAIVTVIDKSTGETVVAELHEGVLNFDGKAGGEYVISVNHDGYEPASKNIIIPDQAEDLDSVSIVLTKKRGAEPATHDNSTKITARISDNDGNLLQGAVVTVIEKSTGKTVPSQFQQGTLTFEGEKEKEYTITADHDGYQTASAGIVIPQEENSADSISITMQKIDTAAEPISLVTVDSVSAKEDVELTTAPIEKFPASSTLIILNSDGKNGKCYLTSDESHYEIVETDGVLYITNKQETKRIGEGTLSTLIENATPFLSAGGLPEDRVVTLKNIYFDFNKATLDEADKSELNKAHTLLQKYPALQLNISAHADERGADSYNLNLSRRRARAVRLYLSRNGIKPQRLTLEALGESAPVVPCQTQECNEDDYQKNRRAELTLNATSTQTVQAVVQEVAPAPANKAVKPTTTEQLPESKPQPAEGKDKYVELLEKYGDMEREGLVFKISVGAYRYNPNLTFSELHDLGNIEKQLKRGINFYYLGDFTSLKVAEDIRQQVIERGVPDAYISIFYNGESISFAKFLSMVKQ